MTITVTVRNFTGKATSLDVDLNTEVADVKVILARTGLCKNAEIALAFKGHKLRDHRSLSHYDIADRDVLHILPPSKTPKLPLQFEKLDGGHFSFEVDCDTTVAQVMRDVATEEKIDVHKLTFLSALEDPEDPETMFVSAPRDLPEDASILDYPLSNSTIFICGPPPPLTPPVVFNVCVRLYDDGRKLDVQAKLQQTLNDFRQAVQLQHNISIADDVLILVGKEVVGDEIPIWDLGFVPDCTVHAVPFISFNVEIVWVKSFGTTRLHPLTRLSTIRKKLEQEADVENIALDKYWFTLDGKEHLKEWRSLWDLDLVVGSTIYMRTCVISVMIQAVDSTTQVELEVEEDETIWGLKERWTLVSGGTLTDQLTLMYRGKYLEDGKTLKEEGLVGGETLRCVVRKV